MGAVRLLLDTHAFVWAVREPDRLGRRGRQLIEDPLNEVLVSAASAFEMATKYRLGKFPEAERIVHGFSSAIAQLRSTELHVTVEHSLAAGSLEHPHRDPFDRLLAAQAAVEGATLVTSDSAFDHFPVATAW